MAEPHALTHEVSAFIYIYIYIYWLAPTIVTNKHVYGSNHLSPTMELWRERERERERERGEL